MKKVRVVTNDDETHREIVESGSAESVGSIRWSTKFETVEDGGSGSSGGRLNSLDWGWQKQRNGGVVFGDEMFELKMMGGACDGAESAAVSFWGCPKWSKACLLC